MLALLVQIAFAKDNLIFNMTPEKQNIKTPQTNELLLDPLTWHTEETQTNFNKMTNSAAKSSNRQILMWEIRPADRHNQLLWFV